MIELKKLGYKYKRKGEVALSNVSAKIGPGAHLLIGENGAGKTTLLHLIAGLTRPSSGECLLDGNPTSAMLPEDMRRTFLVEENMHFPGTTIREFAKRHTRFYPNFSEESFNANLEAFGLSGNEPLRAASTGNRKKAQLAYALALGVDVLLLDEPTNALDIQSKETLRGLISRNMHDEQIIIVATHTIAELENLYEGALMLTRAHLMFAGSEESVTARLVFRAGRMPEDDALYQEIQPGRVLSICRREAGEPQSRINWRLLYSALYSPQRESIIKALTER